LQRAGIIQVETVRDPYAVGKVTRESVRSVELVSKACLSRQKYQILRCVKEDRFGGATAVEAARLRRVGCDIFRECAAVSDCYAVVAARLRRAAGECELPFASVFSQATA
jgi:hypothetical protein